MLGKIEGRRKVTEDKMVGWHHRLDECKFVQAPAVGDGQGSLACCSPRGCKESDTTEQLNNRLERMLIHIYVGTAAHKVSYS